MSTSRFLMIACAALAGCAKSATAPANPQIVVGVIEAGGTLDQVLAGPTAGAVGEPLTFTVTTFGNSCVSAAGAQVINQGLQMTIVPLDAVADGTCRDALFAIPREVTVVFDRAGEAVLRVQGRSYVGESPALITQPMQIRP